MYYWKTILYWQFIRFCPASSYKTRSSVRHQVSRSWGLADILSQWTRKLVLTFCELILWFQLRLPYALQVQLSVFSFKKATLKQRGGKAQFQTKDTHLSQKTIYLVVAKRALTLLGFSGSSESLPVHSLPRPVLNAAFPQPSWCSLPSQKWLLTFLWNHGAL